MLHGKEVFNFFTIYNIKGIISIFVFCILMFFVVLKTLNLKLEHNINNYGDFLELLKNKYPFFNNNLFLLIINIFLAVTFYIMLVGLSTLFNYQFGFQKIIITLVVVLLCYNILNKNNLNFLYIINSILMPVLILFISFLSINNINISKIEIYNNKNIIFSIFSGLIYFSYNSLLIIPILFKIQTTNKKNNLLLSLFFCLIIFILAILINLLLLTYFNYIKNIDLPILAICNLKNNIFSFLYFFIILSAILSTLFSAGFSFIANINKKNKKIILILFLSLSFIFNYFSLSNLIDIFYPIFGLLGFVQIFLILFNKY